MGKKTREYDSVEEIKEAIDYMSHSDNKVSKK